MTDLWPDLSCVSVKHTAASTVRLLTSQKVGHLVLKVPEQKGFNSSRSDLGTNSELQTATISNHSLWCQLHCHLVHAKTKSATTRSFRVKPRNSFPCHLVVTLDPTGSLIKGKQMKQIGCSAAFSTTKSICKTSSRTWLTPTVLTTPSTASMEAPSEPFNGTALSKHGRLRGSIGTNQAYDMCIYIIYNYIQDKVYYIYIHTYIYLPLLKHSEHLQTVNSHGAA